MDRSPFSGDARSGAEVELKFVVRREEVESLLRAHDQVKHKIDQVYVGLPTAARYALATGLERPEDYAEWRLRRRDDRYFFTAKGTPGLSRQEFESEIHETLYAEMVDDARSAGKLARVQKTRYVLHSDLSAQCAELDVYHETGGAEVVLDFVTCELEFPDEAAAMEFRRRGPSKDWPLLAGAIDVTGHPAFTNRILARDGFPANDFDSLAKWLEEHAQGAH